MHAYTCNEGDLQLMRQPSSPSRGLLALAEAQTPIADLCNHRLSKAVSTTSMLTCHVVGGCSALGLVDEHEVVVVVGTSHGRQRAGG